MSVLFDTSVLVPALVVAHPQHSIAFPWLKMVHDGKLAAAVTSHALAETFAVLTTLPHRPRISPEAALEVIRSSVIASFRVLALTSRDYDVTLRQLARASLSGGIVYDGLAARAATKTKTKRVLTFNDRDFRRLAKVFPIEVTVPTATR